MQSSAQRVLSGPAAVKAFNRVRETEQRRDAWPYEWLCPSEAAKPVFQSAVIAAPAVNTQALVLEYTVPAGEQFALCGLVQLYSGAGYVPGDGDILWSVDVDSPLGVLSFQGFPLPGLGLIQIPLGGFVGTAGAGGVATPWEFRKPWILKQNAVLRSKVYLPDPNPVTGVNNAISAGSPNFLISVFSGFTWPS